MRAFRRDVVAHVLFVFMRREVCLRTIDLSGIPKYWLTDLVRRRWFRAALARGPAPTKKMGVKRTVEVVLGPPPKPVFYDMVSRMARDAERDSVNFWKGVECRPFSERIDRSAVSEHMSYSPPSRNVRLKSSVWSFCWPKPVWDFLSGDRRFLVDRRGTHSKWIADHPFLHTVRSVTFRCHPTYRIPFCTPLYTDFVLYTDGVLRSA